MEAVGPVGGQLQLPADDMVNLNPLDDSSLNAFLEDLQEGTFLSLLQDDKLFSDLKSCPLSPSKGTPLGDESISFSSSGFPFEELFGSHGELVECGIRELGASSYFQDCEDPSAAMTETGNSSELYTGKFLQASTPLEEMDLTCSRKAPSRSLATPKERSSSRLGGRSASRKRPRVTHVRDLSSESDSDISSTDSEATEGLEFFVQPEKRSKQDCPGRSQEAGYLLSCVQHDHCYTSCMTGNGKTAEDGSVDSNEEGSSSDAGYETMSASTSPGGSSTSHSSSLSPVSTSPPSTLPASSHAHPPYSTIPSLPALAPLGPNTDPVALIDARIKHFMCSRQVSLTEEEKETLKAEGLPIPTTLPLTKTEEKALKTVRRKIRNKMAAQESRRRKKEHVQILEDKVRQHANENLRLKKKMETLETENKSLAAQLKKLHAMVTCTTPASGSGRTTQVGACLMVLVLCFAIFLGNYGPQRSSTANDYTTPTVRSRSLLSVENPQNFHKAACDLLSHIFLRDADPRLPSNDPPPTGSSSIMEVSSQRAEGGEGEEEEGMWDKWDLLGRWGGGDQEESHRPDLCASLQHGNDSCMSVDA